MERTDSISNNKITSGIIWKQILAFFFPIFFGTIFQQLYNTVDAVIVGQYLGKQALAAVGGGTSTAINLTIGFVVGLSSGATVIISQFYGAKDQENVSKSVHNAMALAIYGGIAVSLIGYLSTVPLLEAIKTPSDVIDQASSYMHIYFAGAISIVTYNIGSSIFRAFGDSRNPLLFLIAGCFANIALDLLFVVKFNLGIEGAAYATVLSQVLSSVLIIIKLRKKTDCCHLEWSKIRFYRPMLSSTISIGLPSGIQSVMYSISNLLITATIFSFGTDCAAGWSAFNKLDNINWMVTNSFGIAITTFAGQNYGAFLFDRVKKGTKNCIVMLALSCVFVSLMFKFFGQQGLMLFTTDSGVIECGMKMIKIVCPFYACYTFVEILSGTMRGCGRTFWPTVITFACICVFRAAWLVFSPLFMESTLESTMIIYPITWILTSILMIICYKTCNIYNKTGEAK